MLRFSKAIFQLPFAGGDFNLAAGKDAQFPPRAIPAVMKSGLSHLSRCF
jgi:hypothetical protein